MMLVKMNQIFLFRDLGLKYLLRGAYKALRRVVVG
jgi:hypothetical protein